MIYVALALTAIAFVVSFRMAGVVDTAKLALGTSRDALSSLSDPTLTDDQKEISARKASIALIRNAGEILARTFVAMLPSGLIVLTFLWTGWVNSGQFLAAMTSIPFLLIVGAGTVAEFWFRAR